MTMNKKKISVVIPIYNEEENLPELQRRLEGILNSLSSYNYEILYVNDGSNDNSWNIIKNFTDYNEKVKAVSFSRNFGHQICFSAGIDYTTGDAVILMDGDLQDPPEVIPEFIKKWEEGYQVVYGIRKKRKENVFKRFAYFSFYRILQKLVPFDIPLDTGDFGLMDKRIVQQLKKMPERNRFLRGLRNWIGFQQIGLEYERLNRCAGKPKYTFIKLLKLALDGIISFSKIPLRIASIFGFIISLSSFIFMIKVIINRLIYSYKIPGITTVVVLILFIGGAIIMILGIIGEYIGRIYDEVKARPLYIINEIINL